MIRHTVFFRFRSDVPESMRHELLREYKTFPSQFPAMHNFTLGANSSTRDQSYEYAFSVDFSDEAGLLEYLNSKEHEEHVVQRFRPMIASRAIVSYEVQPGEITTLAI